MATAALTGTLLGGVTEAAVVAGGRTIIITLTGDTWIPARVTSARGPQVITQPVGSVLVTTSDSIAAKTAANPAGTTFWIEAGIHTITANITPKSGNVYVGEYGAILDGTSWTSTAPEDGAFNSLNGGITNVTIRNLVIRNMPQKAVQWDGTSNTWLVEYNDLHHNSYGVAAGADSIVQHNLIHHNEGPGGPAAFPPYLRGGGYTAYLANNILFYNNEIAYNGPEQKIGTCNSVIFRGNWVHHNVLDGIWYDTNHTNHGSIVEDNIVEYHTSRDGISWEDEIGGIIRNNIVRHNLEGIFFNGSQNVEIYGNTLEDNQFSISLLIDLASVGPPFPRDLQNNNIHDNIFIVTASSGQKATILSSVNAGASMTPYQDNSKNNNFYHNTYYVVNDTDVVWNWVSNMNWTQWQASPHSHDADGTLIEGAP